MPSAPDAKDWAAKGGLHGIGDSLYTPFSGTDGDDIDFDAYRASCATAWAISTIRCCG